MTAADPRAIAALDAHLAYVEHLSLAGGARRAMRRGFGRFVTAEVVNRGFGAGARASVLMASRAPGA